MADILRACEEWERQQAAYFLQEKLRNVAQDAYYARKRAVEDEFALREAERRNQTILDCEFVVVDEKTVETPK